jgi:hypothetical protein
MPPEGAPKPNRRSFLAIVIGQEAYFLTGCWKIAGV